jgi:hypothetical protein
MRSTGRKKSNTTLDLKHIHARLNNDFHAGNYIAEWLISHIIVITRLSSLKMPKMRDAKSPVFSSPLSLCTFFLFSIHQALIFKSHDDATRLFLWPERGRQTRKITQHTHSLTHKQVCSSAAELIYYFCTLARGLRAEQIIPHTRAIKV